MNKQRINIRSKEKAQFLWNMIGSTVYAFTSLILTYGTIKMIGEERGGVFAIALTLAQMFMYIVFFETRNYQVTDVRDRFCFGDYHAVKLLNSLIMMAAIGLYVILHQYSPSKNLIIILVSFYRLLDGYADVYESEFHKRGRLDIAGKSMTFRSIISVGAYFIVLAFTDNLVTALLFAVLSGIVGIAVCDIFALRLIRPVRFTFRVTSVKAIYPECFPLFLGMFLWTYLLSASRIAVDNVMPSKYQAYYQVLFIPISVINLFAGFLIRPSLISMSEQYASGDNRFWNRLWRMAEFIVGLTVAAMLGAYLLGIPVLEVLAGCDLKEYRFMFVFLIAAGGVNAEAYLLYHILTIFRARKSILSGYGIAAFIALISSTRMVKLFGLWGASISYLITVTVLLVIFTGCILKHKAFFIRNGA